MPHATHCIMLYWQFLGTQRLHMRPQAVIQLCAQHACLAGTDAGKCTALQLNGREHRGLMKDSLRTHSIAITPKMHSSLACMSLIASLSQHRPIKKGAIVLYSMDLLLGVVQQDQVLGHW